jgi:hypothetical protein
MARWERRFGLENESGGGVVVRGEGEWEREVGKKKDNKRLKIIFKYSR